MVSFITPSKAREKLVNNVRNRRLGLELTQEGLSNRSGVPLSTLRKFEQSGSISLEAFLKILMVLDGLDDMVKATEPNQSNFSSIDDVLNTENNKPKRQRGKRK